MTFEDRLIETGGQIDTTMAEYGPGYGRDAEFRYRWQADKVEVGLNETFDRWAADPDLWQLYRKVRRRQ